MKLNHPVGLILSRERNEQTVKRQPYLLLLRCLYRAPLHCRRIYPASCWTNGCDCSDLWFCTGQKNVCTAGRPDLSAEHMTLELARFVWFPGLLFTGLQWIPMWDLDLFLSLLRLIGTSAQPRFLSGTSPIQSLDLKLTCLSFSGALISGTISLRGKDLASSGSIESGL